MAEPAAAMKELLARCAAGRPLSEAEAENAFDLIMSGEATPSQIGGFLMALRTRGETVDEITGAARAMRQKALTIRAPAGAVDTCGTGGDEAGTVNVSTAAALVVAACGAPVAKHGNRASSSRSGSADVLKALGVNTDAEPETVERGLAEMDIGFLMAPRHHAAMRHVAGPRKELGTRTIFNLLGPLSNPAGADRQVVGVFHRDWVEPMAEVLGRLGVGRAWVVHGADGLDELTVTGPTHVAEVRGDDIVTFTVEPESVGLGRWTLDDLRGSDAEANAEALRRVLAGDPGAYRDIVVLNAAAALVVTDRATSLDHGVAQAALAIDEGRAQQVLDRLVAFTNAAGASA